MSSQSTRSEWQAAVDRIHWNSRPFVGGRYQNSQSDAHINLVNPATETVLGHMPVGCDADINEAVRVARQSVDDGRWAQLSASKRATVLCKLADLIAHHKADLALLDTLEMGKPISASLYDAEHFAPSLLKSWASFADKLVGEAAPLIGGVLSFNTYEPRGVVGAITPWNFPLVNCVFKLGPALAAGNSIVIKPSEISPSSALRIAELALEAGVPEGVLNVVPGLGSTVGAALALHAGVDMLSFTGSTRTGRRIIEMSGQSNGKPLLLELGGKSPQIVFDDVKNLDVVADAVVQSFLWNSGQVCSAHTRLIVHSAIKDSLIQKVAERTRRFTPADPLDERTTMGPLASTAQRERVRAYIEQGLQSGAKAIILGAIQESGGCFVSPTIFGRVTADMSIVKEEIFGPVLCVQSFDTDEEAIALANGTDFGLAATAWTSVMARTKRLAQRLSAGYVSIRTSGEEKEDAGYSLSYEAKKASGFGCEIGIRSLQSYCALKLVQIIGA